MLTSQHDMHVRIPEEFGTTQDEDNHAAIETTAATIYFLLPAIKWQWYLPYLCGAFVW